MNLLNVNQVRFNGSDIKLMKLDGIIIYEIEEQKPFYIEYTLDNGQNMYALNAGRDSSTWGLPRIYSDSSNYTFDGYEDIEITLLDGTITTDVTATCDQVAKIKLWYPEETVAVKFQGEIYSSPSIYPVIKTINYCNANNLTDASYMFYGCNKLTSLDLSNLDTSNVTNMAQMFYYCSSLTSLDLSNFDTSNVTDMNNMFYYCSSLITLNINNWDTSNVTDMNCMFQACPALTTLDLSDLDTNNVTNMNQMFYDCSSLTSLDVSNFNTSNVTDMGNMFNGCSSLTELSLSNFNTSNVTNIDSMFYNCSALTSLDVSSFDVSNITYMSNMFTNCSSLISLDLSNWDVGKCTSSYSINNMLNGCTALTNLQAPKNIKANMNLSSCTNLTHDSLMSIINNLATVTSTKTLTLGATNLAKLTDEEKAIATNKGWTLK